MKNFKLLAALALAVFVIIVALQNTDEVDTHILFATVSMSRALLIAVTFASGGLVGLAAGLWMARARRAGANEAE
jgi:uncharacterized integral membrane protein